MNAAGNGLKAISRTSPQLFRDCLRLVNHIAGKSKKGVLLRKIVKSEFMKNSKIEDPVRIENLKSNAIRGLANYLMIESASKDERLQKGVNAYAQKQADEMQKNSTENTKAN
jgi:hypothetical protein